MPIPESIALLKRQAGELDAADPNVAQRLMDVVLAYGPAVTQCIANRAYGDGEQILADWKQFLDDNEGRLSANQQLMARGRYNQSAGLFWESRAEHDYFVAADFVQSPALFERSEGHHERAEEFFKRWQPPADAPPDLLRFLEKTLADEQAEVWRVRGMKLLAQGEFELEAGALTRAQALLDEAIKAMRTAEAKANPGQGPSGTPSPSSLHFIDYAEAMRLRAQSDQALLKGDLNAAAEAQDQRAKALEACQAMHARADTTLGDGFARRLARDAHVARQRHDRFLAAAAAQPRWGWLKSLVFLVVAIVPPSVLVYWIGPPKDAPGAISLITLLLLYTLVVAGVGSKLIQWREGADWLAGAVSKLPGGKEK